MAGDVLGIIIDVDVDKGLESARTKVDKFINGYKNSKGIEIPVTVNPENVNKSIDAAVKGGAGKASKIKVGVELSAFDIQKLYPQLEKQIAKFQKKTESLQKGYWNGRFRDSISGSPASAMSRYYKDLAKNDDLANSLNYLDQLADLEKRLRNSGSLTTSLSNLINGERQAVNTNISESFVKDIDALEQKLSASNAPMEQFAAGIRDVRSAISEASSSGDWNAIGEYISSMKQDAASAIAAFKQEQKVTAEINKAMSFEDKRSAGITNVNSYIEQLSSLGLTERIAEAEQLRAALSNATTDADLSHLNAQFVQLKAELADDVAEAERFRNTIQSMQTGVNGNIANIDQMLSFRGMDANTDGIGSLRDELIRLRQEYVNTLNVLSSGQVQNGTPEFQELQQTLALLDRQLQSASTKAKLFNNSIASNLNLDKANTSIQQMRDRFTQLQAQFSRAQLSPELASQMDHMAETLRNVDAVNFQNAQRELTGLGNAIKAAGYNADDFATSMRSVGAYFGRFFSVASIFGTVANGARKAYSAVKELDTAMIELKKVTDLSERSYDKYLDSAAQRSREIGTSLVDYVSSTADFARLGYSVSDATMLAEQANMLMQVGDGINNVEIATDGVIAAMKAFGMSVQDTSTIVDKLNEVSNKTSATTGDLVNALTRGASALSVGGNSLEESLGLIVAGNETVRNAESVGAGLKTLSLRIRGKICASHYGNMAA